MTAHYGAGLLVTNYLSYCGFLQVYIHDINKESQVAKQNIIRTIREYSLFMWGGMRAIPFEILRGADWKQKKIKCVGGGGVQDFFQSVPP